MENVVGKRFLVEDEEFTVVDSRNIAGETMIYADRITGKAGPARAAFRLSDIEDKLTDHIAA